MATTARGVGEVLLELLGKVPDAATLELLLEPEHLLRLLRAHGFADDEVRRALKSGAKSPGELLLEVLAKQPDTSVLLGVLGNPKPTPRRERAADARDAASPVREAVAARAAAPAVRVALGLLVGLPAAWYLFVRLDFLRVPGLALHFPKAYALLVGLVVGGVALVASGLLGISRRPRAG